VFSPTPRQPTPSLSPFCCPLFHPPHHSTNHLAVVVALSRPHCGTPFSTRQSSGSPRARPRSEALAQESGHTRGMLGAAEGESQDSAFLRQALLEAGIGAASPCPSLQGQPSSTTAVPVMMVAPSQGANVHPVVSTSRKGRARRLPSMPPTLRTVHPEGVGQYRQRLFDLVEPLVLSAEEYIAYWPYISNAYTRNKRLPLTAAGTITEHWWCRLWSSNALSSKGQGQRGKTIRIGVGCPFKLKDVLDVASGSHTLSRHRACSNHCHTLDFSDSVKKPEALQRLAGAEVA